jgi:hypothetical protein
MQLTPTGSLRNTAGIVHTGIVLASDVNLPTIKLINPGLLPLAKLYIGLYSYSYSESFSTAPLVNYPVKDE